MGLRQVLCGILVAALVGVAAAAEGEAPPAPPDVDALKKQMDELRQTERELFKKLREIEAKVRKSPELADLQKAHDDAVKAYDQKAKADPALAAARQAEREALAALQEIVGGKVAANDQAQAVRKELENMDDREARLDYQEAIARLELTHRSSPINRALDKDPELAKLRQAASAAQRAMVRADDAAREAARKVYNDASKLYQDARKAKLEAMPDAKKVTAEIESIRKAFQDLRQEEREARTRLDATRRDIERGDDPEVKAGRDKADAARKAVRDAYNSEELQAARKAVSAAQKAYYGKVRELTAKDPAAAPLLDQRAAVRKQIGELYRKLRAARK